MTGKTLATFGLLLALSVSSLHAQPLAECNRKYEYERTCSCKAKFSRDPSADYKDTFLPIRGEYSYCDNDDLSYHECFKGSCIQDCYHIIRDQLEFDDSMADKLVTQSTGNHFCEWTKEFLGESVTEGGLRIFIESTPGLCDRHYKEISHDVCCFRRCTCQMMMDAAGSEDIVEIDLGHLLPEKEPFYNCSLFEFGECEQDCRNAAAKYLSNDVIANELVNDLNIFDDTNEYSPALDIFCQSEKSVQEPGLDVKLQIHTGPGSLDLYKQISLGQLCCRQPCICQIESRDDSNKRTETLIDLSEQVQQAIRINSSGKTYYDCSREHLKCKQFCLEAIDQYLNQDVRHQPSDSSRIDSLTSSHFNLLDDDGFDESPNKARDELCKVSSTPSIKSPGNQIYARLHTNNTQLFKEETLALGRLCCVKPCKCELIAKNFATPALNDAVMNNFENSALSKGAKLLKDLSDYLPRRDVSYDCSKETENCITDCQKAAGAFLNNEMLSKAAHNQTVQDLDIFFTFASASKLCLFVGKALKSPGIDVYISYSTSTTSASSKYSYEDLHVGRICCDEFSFPANKCKYPIYPNVETSTLKLV